jgi:hypothetical protein
MQGVLKLNYNKMKKLKSKLFQFEENKIEGEVTGGTNRTSGTEETYVGLNGDYMSFFDSGSYKDYRRFILR